MDNIWIKPRVAACPGCNDPEADLREQIGTEYGMIYRYNCIYCDLWWKEILSHRAVMIEYGWTEEQWGKYKL